jgi:hypothetical protein
MNAIYSIVYFKIPELNTDNVNIITNNFNNYFSNLINNLDDDNITKFFINPNSIDNNVKEHRFIFIGNYTMLNDYTNIEPILRKIENTKEITNDDFIILKNIYSDDFFTKLQKILNASVNQTIQFVPYQILPDDTITTIYQILSTLIENTDMTYFHMFGNIINNLPNSWQFDIKHKIFEALRGYVATIHKNTTIPSIDDIKNVLWSFGVPFQVIDKVLSETSYKVNDIYDIVNIIESPLIIQWLKYSLSFNSPAYTYYYNYKDLKYQIWSNPFLYINKENNPYYNLSMIDTKIYIRNNKKGYECIIDDILPTNDDTLYIYNISDFRNIMSEGSYEHTYLKLFPLWKKEKNFKVENKDSLENSLKNRNNIASSLNSFKNFNYNYSSTSLNQLDKFIMSTRNTPLYLELYHRIYTDKKIDLLTVFNNILVNQTMPLMILYDRELRENVYKIYRPITEKISNDDIDYPVSARELDRWLNYTSYILEGNILEDNLIKDAKDIIRGLQIKILWKTVREDNLEKIGKIIEINNSINPVDKVGVTVNVNYNNKIIRNIPWNNDFIINYVNNPTVGTDIKFYTPKKTYIDISLDDKGRILVKCPWKYLTINKIDDIKIIISTWLELLIPILDVYVGTVYNTPLLDKIKNDWYYNIIYNLTTFNRYSRYIGGSTYIQEFDYKYIIKLPNDCNIIYNDFIKILRSMKSLFIVNEPILKVGDTVEYYDKNKMKWISMIISVYNIEADEYTIFNTNNVKVENVKRNYLRIPKKSDGRNIERTDEIRMTYYKVSDFNIMSSIQQFILRMIQSKYENDKIIEKLVVEYNITIDDAKEIYKRYNEQIKLFAYLKFETGVDIIINYKNVIQLDNYIGYNILIKNIHSINELEKIQNIINYVMTVYIYTKYNKYKELINGVYIEYLKDILKRPEDTEIIETKEITTEEISADLQEELMEQDINIDDIMDEYQYEEIEPAEEDLRIEEESDKFIEDEYKETDLEEEKKTQIELVTKIGRQTNDVLKLLIKRDATLFNWASKDDPTLRYPRACQKGSQVKTFTDEEKKIIDRDHPGSYGDGDLCDSTNDEFMKKLKLLGKKGSKDKLLCSAIKYGTTPYNQNWYYCPKIYDIKRQIPLNVSDLTFEIPGFDPIDNDRGWRTSKDGRDILDFKPSYMGYSALPDKEYDIKGMKSLVFAPLKSYNFYPGFNNPVDTDKGIIYAPCCYLKSNHNLYEAFTGMTSKMSSYTEYILGWGKSLGIGRLGYLNNYLNECFGVEPCSPKNEKCFKRYGGSQSFLYAVSKIVGINDYDIFLKTLLSQLTDNLFNRLNRGTLRHQFKTDGIISP